MSVKDCSDSEVLLLMCYIGVFLCRIQKPKIPSQNSAQGLKLVLWTSTPRTTITNLIDHFVSKGQI